MIMIMMFDDNGMKLVLFKFLYYFSNIRRFSSTLQCRGALLRATVKIQQPSFQYHNLVLNRDANRL